MGEIRIISIVCVYNNDEVLKTWLLKSLEAQNSVYEFIPINNNELHFKSAAQALNYGGKKAAGKYIMFVHQDIDLLSPSFLEDAEKLLDNISDVGVAGIIGMSWKGANHKSRIRNVILEHENPITKFGEPIQTHEEVQTIDECLFFIPKDVFEKYPFDEVTCDNWHFYAVDYCLSIRYIGLKPYVLPIKVHHRSQGFYIKFTNGIKSIQYLREFSASLNKLINKHKKNNIIIYTTNGDYRTDINPYLQISYVFILRLFIMKVYRKICSIFQ